MAFLLCLQLRKLCVKLSKEKGFAGSKAERTESFLQFLKAARYAQTYVVLAESLALISSDPVLWHFCCLLSAAHS